MHSNNETFNSPLSPKSPVAVKFGKTTVANQMQHPRNFVPKLFLNQFEFTCKFNKGFGR